MYTVRNGDNKNYKRDLAIVIAKVGVILVGVAMAAYFAADWGAEHQLVGQPVVAQALRLQFPVRIEDVEPQVIISPVVERWVDQREFSPMEQKVIDRWGYREGIIALAIFECESGLDQYAVSATGDLGVAQINWQTWRNLVEEMGRTSADLLNDVDFNLDVAYIVWDRGDGIEGNGEGSWEAWTVYRTGVYLHCLQR